MQQNITNKAYLLSKNGYFFNVNSYISKAWETMKPHWLIFSSFTAVYIAILTLLLRTPEIGQIVQMLISGPITAGYYLTIHRVFNNEPISFENFLDGFKIFLPSLVVSLVVGLFTTAGLILFIIPAFFFMLIYLFAMPLVVFDKIYFWTAMESSRVIILKRFKEALILGIAILGINILGVLAFGLGLLFTIPLSYAIIYSAYMDIYGLEEVEDENNFNYFK